MNGPRRGIGTPSTQDRTGAKPQSPSSSTPSPSARVSKGPPVVQRSQEGAKPATASGARVPSANKPVPKEKTTATSTTAARAGKGKKTKKARDIAQAFASGKVTLGQALGLTPAQKDVMKRRAFALVQEKKTDLAIPILEGLVALDPFDAWVLLALGGLLVDKGDHAVAEALLTRALAVTPGDATAHAMRAEARVKQGNTAGARADLAVIAGADLSNPAVRRAKALEIALSKI
jgi:predicted Zn-dependent protease